MRSKKSLSSGATVVACMTVLSLAFLASAIINPAFSVLEAIAMSAIAAILSGIYVEIKRANDERTDKS